MPRINPCGSPYIPLSSHIFSYILFFAFLVRFVKMQFTMITNSRCRTRTSPQRHSRRISIGRMWYVSTVVHRKLETQSPTHTHASLTQSLLSFHCAVRTLERPILPDAFLESASPAVLWILLGSRCALFFRRSH